MKLKDLESIVNAAFAAIGELIEPRFRSIEDELRQQGRVLNHCRKRLRGLQDSYDQELRDQFAMAALTGSLTSDPDEAEGMARMAYQLADAMLEARKPQPGVTDATEFIKEKE